jgi:hypothetical protein
MCVKNLIIYIIADFSANCNRIGCFCWRECGVFDIFGKPKGRRGGSAIEQYKNQNTYQQEKDEELQKFLVLFF